MRINPNIDDQLMDPAVRSSAVGCHISWCDPPKAPAWREARWAIPASIALTWFVAVGWHTHAVAESELTADQVVKEYRESLNWTESDWFLSLDAVVEAPTSDGAFAPVLSSKSTHAQSGSRFDHREVYRAVPELAVGVDVERWGGPDARGNARQERFVFGEAGTGRAIRYEMDHVGVVKYATFAAKPEEMSDNASRLLKPHLAVLAPATTAVLCGYYARDCSPVGCRSARGPTADTPPSG